MAQESAYRISFVQPYYTPKTLEIQAFFALLMFFVDYALNLCQHIYVNQENLSIRRLYHFQLYFKILGECILSEH